MSSVICSFPFFSIVLGMICAVTSFVFGVRAARRISYFLTGCGMVFSLSTVLYNLSQGSGFRYMMGHFPAPWGNEIMAGLLEPTMAFLFALVMLLCLVGGQKTILRDVDEKKQTLFYVMADMSYVALLALSYTNDIFTGYVFVEICTLGSCSLVMIRRRGRTLVAATRYLIFSLIGSGLFLIGIILLYDITGHLLFPDLRIAVSELWHSGEYRVPLTVTIALVVSGLAIKSGLFPFHLWMRDTYSTATPSASGILSGLISKGYIFFLLKIICRVIGLEVFWASGVQYVLLGFGIAGMVMGSVEAMHASTINRMIAFSSAAQIGYIYMGLGMGNEGALVAALFQIIAHAITKPLLFLCADALSATAGGKQDFESLRGSARQDPLSAVLLVIAALSMIGIPMFAGFLPKVLFATAAFDGTWQTYLVLGALGISTILNALYFMRAAIVIHLPREGEMQPAKTAPGVAMRLSAVAFAVANLIVGLHAQPLITLLQQGIRWLGA